AESSSTPSQAARRAPAAWPRASPSCTALTPAARASVKAMLEAMRTAFLMPSYDYRALARGLCRASSAWRAAVRLAAMGGLLAACGPREPPLTNPGASTVNPVGATARSDPPDASSRWEGFAELGTYRPVGSRFLSRGHFAGRWKAEILVHPSAA